MTERELYLKARSIRQFAYAPYSGYQVGAALHCTDGTIYTGVNVENASYGATICAERTAFGKAISEGKREFDAIAICSSEGTSWPCGICRQFMAEFAPDLMVITGPDEHHLEQIKLSALMPKGFTL